MTAVTYYTVSDAGFFPGTVAMLNSLRLTGNDGELVIVDGGLSEDQRARLAPHARVERPPADAAGRGHMLKPSIAGLHRDGVAVHLDSDIVVAGSLADVLERAAAGTVCVCPDHPDGLDRSFPEWAGIFALEAPLRPRTYVNAGFFAVGGELAARLLARWAEATGRLDGRPAARTAADPTWDTDQDALNALLMSEVADDQVVDLPDMVIPPELYRVKLVDRESAACTLDGRRLRLVHYTGLPKPWSRRGWTRSRGDAYTRLLPRLLFGADVPLRLDPDEVPPWLRASRLGAATLSTLGVANTSARALASLLPDRAEARLRELRARLART